MDELTLFERRLADQLELMAGPGRRVDALEMARTAARGRRAQTSRTPVDVARFSIAAVVVSLFAGLLLVSLLMRSEDGARLPALMVATPSASTDHEAPIEWQTEVVDFRADSLVLEANGLTFTTDGSLLDLGSDPGQSHWTLEVRWLEHDVEQRLHMYFASDGSDWWVDELRTYDGMENGEWVYTYGPLFRTPIGEDAEGDVRLELKGQGRSGAPGDIRRATLAIDGLRLSVSPRGASGSSSAPPPGRSRPTDLSQGVEYGEITLRGMTAADDVLMVLDDGTEYDLDSPIVDIAIDEDGDVWAAKSRQLSRIGVPGEVSMAIGALFAGPRFISRVDANPDGSLLVQGGDAKGSQDRLAIIDGWIPTNLPPYQHAGVDGATSSIVHSPVRAPDGTFWGGVDGGVAQLDGNEWVVHPISEVAPRRTAAPSRPIEHLAATLDGSIWAGHGQSLSRFDGMAWTEFWPLEAHLAGRSVGEANVRALRAGRDGTLWAVIEMSRDQSALETYLVRYAKPDWSVFPMSDLVPYSELWADEIAVDRDGSVVLVIGPDDAHAPPVDPSAVAFVFDGSGMSRLGRLPWDLRFQSVEVAGDGSVWLVGRPGSGRNDQRLYRIPRGAAASE